MDLCPTLMAEDSGQWLRVALGRDGVAVMQPTQSRQGDNLLSPQRHRLRHSTNGSVFAPSPPAILGTLPRGAQSPGQAEPAPVPITESRREQE